VIKEFEKAAKLAPEWPDVYYNLGLIQEKVGKYSDAIKNLTKYLDLSPNASDARVVKKLVTTMEYKVEKLEDEEEMPKLLEGKWIGGMNYCGGHLEREIIFYKFNDIVSIELPVTWNADLVERTDYMKIPVKIEGKTVRFEFKAKLWFPRRRSESYCHVEIELKLVEPNKLKGIMYHEGADSDREIELTKIN